MAETSEGWDGTVNEAGMARILAAAAPPRIISGFELAAVEGQRRVILTPGESHHGFIRYINDDPITIDLPAPSAGGAWHLIAQRRDWAANTVTTVVLESDVTTLASTAAPIATDYPEGFADTPGVLADFPLYWVWVRSTDNEVRIRKALALIVPGEEWALKSRPSSRPGAPGGPNANAWGYGRDSGGTMNATSRELGIEIAVDGIYDCVAKQRVNGSNPGSGYIALAVNGSRPTLENRLDGAWFHDHGSTNYTSSESRYFGPLYAGELITAGPPAGAESAMYYQATGYAGGMFIRRIS